MHDWGEENHKTTAGPMTDDMSKRRSLLSNMPSVDIFSPAYVLVRKNGCTVQGKNKSLNHKNDSGSDGWKSPKRWSQLAPPFSSRALKNKNAQSSMKLHCARRVEWRVRKPATQTRRVCLALRRTNGAHAKKPRDERRNGL